VERFVQSIAEAGYVNSLAQTLLKLTAPGVPDFYQGSELWDFSLADPDNRRPVDFKRRQRALAELASVSVEEVWRRRAEGLPKLWLIRRVLRSRAEREDWLARPSSYRPLSARGAKSGHVVAFLRGADAITVVPRLVLGLHGDWADTTLELPVGQWQNELTDECGLKGPVALDWLLREFPVAWLTRKEREG
jgi:(1->4)-alpha-D-glucan 1-alpha-D-glucosylmutase